MRYVSLFSGMEAASVAWAHLGWESVAFSEIEPFPCAVLAERFPNVPNLGDITKIDWSPYVGAVDLVVGGSPCQSFSVAGSRTGLAGESGLMWEFCRAVAELNPRWFVWENVPGALSSAGGEDLRCLLRFMDEHGYGQCGRVLDSQYFGVAQRRRRFFLVGRSGADGAGKACAVLLERDSMRWNYPKGREKRQELASRAVHRPVRNRRMDGDGGIVEREIPRVKGPSGTNGPMAYGPDDSVPTLTTTSSPHAVCFQQNQRDEVRLIGGDGSHVGALMASSGGYKEQNLVCYKQNASDEVREMFGDGDIAGSLTTQSSVSRQNIICMNNTTQWESSNGDEVVGALCAADGEKGVGNQYVNQGKCLTNGFVVRRLTPLECERLQGFPDDWTRIPYKGNPAEDCPDTPRYKACGNSMAVPCMAWIGERIALVESLEQQNLQGDRYEQETQQDDSRGGDGREDSLRPDVRAGGGDRPRRVR